MATLTPTIPILIGILALAIVTAMSTVSAMIRWATQRLVDVPNERSSHKIPTPRGGGIGICLVIIPAWYAALTFAGFPVLTTLSLIFLLILVAALGFFDDLWSLPASIRFAAHCAIAMAALFLLGPWRSIWTPWHSAMPLGAASYILTALWVVGLLNAYNFMDGIDGIAGLQGVVAGLGWLGAGWIHGVESWTLIGVAIAGSCIGFLKYNWSPARIFMGDIGSTLLGCSFALLPLLPTASEPVLPSWIPWMAAGVVWPFVFDAVYTFLRRSVRREKVWAAHRSHIYQRLVIAGASHQTVTIMYGLLAAASTLFVLLASQPLIPPITAVFFLVTSAVFLVVMVHVAEQRHASRSVGKEL